MQWSEDNKWEKWFAWHKVLIRGTNKSSAKSFG